MRPILFLGIEAYSTFLVLAFLVGLAITLTLSTLVKIPKERVIALTLFIFLASLLGARLFHIFFDGKGGDYFNLCFHPNQLSLVEREISHPVLGCYTDRACSILNSGYLCNIKKHFCYSPVSDCWAWAKIWNGGLVYYGGFFAGVLSTWIYLRRKKLSFLTYADLFSPGIALGLCIGRLGCFLQGCCFGKNTNSFLGVVFPKSSLAWKSQLSQHEITSAATHSLPVHAAQLYEALGCLLLFVFLYHWMRKQTYRSGEILGLLLSGYGILRIICEFFRNDDRGILWHSFSTSQIISVPLILIGVYLLRKKGSLLPVF